MRGRNRPLSGKGLGSGQEPRRDHRAGGRGEERGAGACADPPPGGAGTDADASDEEPAPDERTAADRRPAGADEGAKAP